MVKIFSIFVLLTGCLVDGDGQGLHVVAHGRHRNAVVAAWLELVQAELCVRHGQAAAVPGEPGLQLVISHLQMEGN